MGNYLVSFPAQWGTITWKWNQVKNKQKEVNSRLVELLSKDIANTVSLHGFKEGRIRDYIR